LAGAGHELGLAQYLGDVNGDLLDDFAVIEANGTSYVIFGSVSLPSPIDITALDGTNGFSIVAVNALQTGVILTTGDFNADGYRDIAVFVPGYFPTTVILFNEKNVWPASIDVSNNNINHYSSVYTADQSLGYPYSLATFDLNGDAIDDLLVPKGSGLVYILGKRDDPTPTPSVSPVPPSPSSSSEASSSPAASPSGTSSKAPSATPTASRRVDKNVQKTRSTSTPTRRPPTPSPKDESSSTRSSSTCFTGFALILISFALWARSSFL